MVLPPHSGIAASARGISAGGEGPAFGVSGCELAALCPPTPARGCITPASAEVVAGALLPVPFPPAPAPPLPAPAPRSVAASASLFAATPASLPGPLAARLGDISADPFAAGIPASGMALVGTDASGSGGGVNGSRDSPPSAAALGLLAFVASRLLVDTAADLVVAASGLRAVAT
ncbi:MAG TPA: hypothetical protein VFG30_00180 [Polyangiales bacterium]|nr:hypothetical protein [Polyangiales bacterium]